MRTHQSVARVQVVVLWLVGVFTALICVPMYGCGCMDDTPLLKYNYCDCGAEGIQCCRHEPNSLCNEGLTCDDFTDTCVQRTCGINLTPCCAGGSCIRGRACVGGICVFKGGEPSTPPACDMLNRAR